MVKTITKKDMLNLIYRLVLISICISGILWPSKNSFWGQFWFFTIQTNIFVIILIFFKTFSQLCGFFDIKIKFIYTSWFNAIKIAITFYITIAGIIFCFVLAPVALVTNTIFFTHITYRDIALHVIVPLMTIIEYYACEEKIILKCKNAILFLIYPIFYVLTIFFRALAGGKAFPDGSKYPYFFIDPTFNNQGWLVVLFYSLLFLLAFYLLALLYIFVNNKLTKKTT